MSSKKFDVVSIGNALVDVLAHIEDEFLDSHGVARGVMQLIDLPRAQYLYSLMMEPSEHSGGSAANTAASLAVMGSRSAYIGKVKDDRLGQVFSDDLADIGTDYRTGKIPADAELETGRSMILVSPDGERSMNTYLGASEFLMPADIDREIVCNTSWLFLEGYRFDGPDSQSAYRIAADACQGAGGRVALSLSDPFCIERHREAFRDLITTGTDMVIGNREEFLSLYRTTDLAEALGQAASEKAIMVCTLSDEGVAVIADGNVHRIGANPVNVVDATGAGDQFAAGFLFGMHSDLGITRSAEIGCGTASITIGKIGARPDFRDVRKFVASI